MIVSSSIPVIITMSLYWTLIAGFLYAEIALLFLLILPFISTRMWHKIFKSRMIKSLENQLVYYFYVLVAILVLFFVGKMRGAAVALAHDEPYCRTLDHCLTPTSVE